MKKKLDEIVAYKKIEVAQRKQQRSIDVLTKTVFFHRPVLSLTKQVLNPTKTGIIAEFKRQSPSKGILNNTAVVSDVIVAYEQHGASGVSILTDEKYFGGTEQDLLDARHVAIPILRKEFIVDDYQIYEAKAIGADCILLIATCLTKQEILRFSTLAQQLGLEILLELHQETEIEMLHPFINMVGINNRNLQTFEVDLDHSFHLLKKIPSQFVSIAESGIQSYQDIKALRQAGFQGFLIGEQFMKQASPSIAFANFVQECKGLESP